MSHVLGLSKILKIFQKSENLPEIFQKSENLPKIWKSSKNLKIFQKSENSQKILKFMSPHHSDQMSQRSQVSWVALCMSKVKVPSVSQFVSESVTRSPIELLWTAKNLGPLLQVGLYYQNDHISNITIPCSIISTFIPPPKTKKLTTLCSCLSKNLLSLAADKIGH